MLNNSDSGAIQLPVSGIGVDAHSSPSSLLPYNLHVEKGRDALKWPVENLITVNVLKDE